MLRLSGSMAVGSQFPDQGLNPRLLHCKVNSYPLDHQGRPSAFFFLQLDKCPGYVTSPGAQDGTHAFTSYILRPYHVPGTEHSKMAEIIPALENLPKRSKSCRIRTLSESTEGSSLLGHNLTDGRLASKDSKVPRPCTQQCCGPRDTRVG